MYPCLKWKLFGWIYEEFQNLGPGQHNYCRNPDEHAGGVWCHIETDSDLQNWKLCENVPTCL